MGAPSVEQREAREPFQLSVFLISHLFTPGAIILMVCAFLFFLIDLRSVLLPGGNFLKMIGANFVVATVLIVRYAKMYRDRERKYLYLVALAAVTVWAMSSFNSMNGRVMGRGGAWLDLSFSLMIVGAVWWLATAITECLSLEQEHAARGIPQLYGVQLNEAARLKWHAETRSVENDAQTTVLAPVSALERGLEAEPRSPGSYVFVASAPQAVERGDDPAPRRPGAYAAPTAHAVRSALPGNGRSRTPAELNGRSRPREAAGARESASAWIGLGRTLYRAVAGEHRPDSHGNPARAVARLALVALVVFAVGEPLLLAGAPEVGARALLSMVLFLFATGVLMASASGLGLLRHASTRGGSVSLALIPLRMGAGAVLLALVLAAALAVPGVQYRGRGELQAAEWQIPEEARRSERHGSEQARRQGDQADRARGPGDERSEQSGAPPFDGGETRAVAGSLLDTLTEVGGRLLIPVLIAAVLFGLFSLLGMRSLWAGWGARAKSWYDDLVHRLRAALDRRRGLAQSLTDPLAGFEALNHLSPDEAVRQAYGRFMDLSAALGHPRPARLTPLEFLRHLPIELREHQRSVKTLTDLYVRAAYSTFDVQAQEREMALRVLGDLRGAWQPRKPDPAE